MSKSKKINTVEKKSVSTKKKPTNKPKINTVEKKSVSTKKKPTNKPKETISTNNKKEKVIVKEKLTTKSKEKVISKPMERLVTKENPTTKPKEKTVSKQKVVIKELVTNKSKEKKTPSVEYNINQYNIGDNIIFMCLGSETNGVVIKVDKGNKLLVVNGENNIIYHVHLSKTNSQFFYLI